MEHLQEYFAMKTLGHLEQLFAEDQLDNFLGTLEDYPQHYKFLI